MSVTFHFNPSRLNSGLREKKYFFFTFPCGALGFKKALKAFRKPLEAAQKSENKNSVNSYFNITF